MDNTYILKLISKYSKNPPAASLILVNLIPIFGVIFFNWSVYSIVILYWSENLIIGFYNILKMALTANLNNVTKVVMIPLFMFHYGIFCGFHGIFLISILTNDPHNFFDNLTYPGFLILIEPLVRILSKVSEIFPKEMLFPFITLFISHGISFVYNFILNGEYQMRNSKNYMMQPYPRIIILHITIILGAFLINNSGPQVYFLVVLIILKTIVDLFSHLYEHRKVQRKRWY